ncbi:MAG: hypothetical protein OXC48_02385 [Endozoicomonadaceae bacterium]|nr:hypothetical protein [Endozoicomonadaceae bacterium]
MTLEGFSSAKYTSLSGVQPWAEPVEAQRPKAAGLRQAQPTVRPAKAGIFSKKQTCQSKRLNLKNVTKRQPLGRGDVKSLIHPIPWLRYDWYHIQRMIYIQL